MDAHSCKITLSANITGGGIAGRLMGRFRESAQPGYPFERSEIIPLVRLFWKKNARDKVLQYPIDKTINRVFKQLPIRRFVMNRGSIRP
jgi:hypothetical protein